MEFKKFELTAVFSTDGYPSLLAGMKGLTNFGRKFYHYNLVVPLMCDINSKHKCMQDSIHLLNKFKTRLMDTSNCLVLGDYVANMSFLRILLNNPHISKNDHLLNNSDIGTFDSSKDKMNSRSTEKICEQFVIDLLKEHVEGSQGTAAYLQIMRNIHNAFINPTITPLERLYNAFFSLVFTRVWRENTKNGDSTNFITNNIWACLEINCAFLYDLVKSGNGHLVIVWNSQACEELFRTIRSMASHNLTQINFNMLEFLEKINRFEKVQSLSFELRDIFNLEENIKMKSDSSTVNVPKYHPTLGECHDIISKAKEDALKLCEELKMKKLRECDPELFFRDSPTEPEDIEEHLINATGSGLAQPTEVTLEGNIQFVSQSGKSIIKIKNLFFLDEESGKL